MLTHDELIAAKVALHERLLLDILEERFAAQPDPIDQLEAYARRRVTLRPPSQDPAPTGSAPGVNRGLGGVCKVYRRQEKAPAVRPGPVEQA